MHFCNSLVILFQTSQDTPEIHKPVDKNIYLSTIIHEASFKHHTQSKIESSLLIRCSTIHMEDKTMTKFKKVVSAIVVAASVSSIGIASYAATARNQITPNDYCTFKWGVGYAEIINNTEQKRMAYASVNVYKDVTGVQVAHKYDDDTIGFNESVYVSADGYSSNGYNFECSGGIHGDGTHYSPVVWSGSYNVQ